MLKVCGNLRFASEIQQKRQRIYVSSPTDGRTDLLKTPERLAITTINSSKQQHLQILSK